MKAIQGVIAATLSFTSAFQVAKPFLRPSHPYGLHMADVSIRTPSSDAAAQMGIREWPQQLKKGAWEESSSEGQTLVRYVLDGTGSLEVMDVESSTTSTTKLSPGTLVEISGEASLSWNSDGDMIILTPGFEEGGTFLAVAAGVVVLFGALLAGVGS